MNSIKVVDVNSRDMERELKRLSNNLNNHSKNESNRAMSSVINKNLNTIRTKIVRKASVATQIPQKAIRKRVKIIKAKPSNLNAKVWVGINQISAASAGAKPSGSGYAVGPYSWPKGFTNSKLKGGIYERTSTGQYPLKLAAFGESFTTAELKKATDSVIKTNLDNDFQAKLFRELSYRLDKFLKA
jgi:hypothetical protein